MAQHLLPDRMSLPEVMGDPCASELRDHALALLRATASSERLIHSHPGVAEDLAGLRHSVERFASAVLETLAAEAGIPAEGESISRIGAPMGDYRIDRSSGCWIWMRSVTARGYPIVGRKAQGRENVPAKIYWMLKHGTLGEHEIVVRTCGSRLCVNPDHARVTDRREHGAECMRDGSPLDWIGDGDGTLHDVIATQGSGDDPVEELDRKITRELLDGVTDEAIAAMDDAELSKVQARLIDAGIRPSTCRTSQPDQSDQQAA
jgi:hypothetical protein